jgi:hypothetical protein
MNIICTITDKGYQKYTAKLIHSIRASGWDGPIVVFNTSDEPMYFNCEVRMIKPEWVSNIFPDGRWLKMELPNHFELGDKICFLDTDMYAFPWVDWDDIFEGDLAYAELKPDDDVTQEIKKLTSIYGPQDYSRRYLASPAMMKVTKEIRMFYNTVGKLASIISTEKQGGTLLALNIMMYADRRMREQARLLPREKIVYTVDVRGDQKNYMPFDKPWFFHYGGRDGKEYWHQEHELGRDLGYLA